MSTTLFTGETLQALLTEHWLAGISCDETERRDRASCACSRVDLGWQRTVGAAVTSWIEHLLSQLAAQPAPAPEAAAVNIVRMAIRSLTMLANGSLPTEPELLRYLSGRLTTLLQTIEQGG